jgi:arylsulfotransferase ASST
MGRMTRALLAPAPLLVLLAACGDTEPAPAPGGAERVVVPPLEDLSALDELAQLGYVDYAAPDAETRGGVVHHEPERAYPGYTLVTSLPNSRAMLVDMQGREVAAWEDPEVRDSRWSRAEILRNGDVLCLSPKADFLSRLRFDGTLLWRLPLEVHHDGIELPDGRILVLTRKFRIVPEIDPVRRTVDNLLAFVSADGKLLEEHSLYDLLAAEPRVLTVVRPQGLEDLPPGYNIDPIHANTVCWIERPEHGARNPLFTPGRVLVTLRYLDAVALIDLAQGRCLWAWGPGEIEGPHDASVLANGNVLLLDNGYEARGWSRVVELDPGTGKIVWQYRAPEPSSFHTSGRGTVQALPNGDVLVGNSNSGEAFELDREGHVVWRYLNPLKDEQGARGVIRVERYEPAFVDPLLGASATPQALPGR